MKFGNVGSFTRGWLVGDFEPSLFKAKDNDILIEDDIFIYEPLDKSHVEFLEDTILLVIKNPSTKNDKHYNPK